MRLINLFDVLVRVLMIAVVGFTLSACAGSMPASVMGGECRVFHDPGFAVRGRRLKDSQWIGRTQETGIKVCHWSRPAS